jgi:hypothetical protein
VACFLLLAYSLITMVQLVLLGGQPQTAAEAFKLLQANKITGLMRLDLPTVAAMPLYYLLFLGLSAALWRVDAAMVVVSASLAFAGVTLLIATPTALPMLTLAEKHAAASTAAMRMQLEAAGEAVLATNIWRGTGALAGSILLQSSAVLICAVMLRGGIFGKTTAYLGLLTHGLDLAHIFAGFFFPAASTILMAIAGPFYPVWFVLTGRRLFQLARNVSDGLILDARRAGR